MYNMTSQVPVINKLYKHIKIIYNFHYNQHLGNKEEFKQLKIMVTWITTGALAALS